MVDRFIGRVLGGPLFAGPLFAGLLFAVTLVQGCSSLSDAQQGELLSIVSDAKRTLDRLRVANDYYSELPPRFSFKIGDMYKERSKRLDRAMESLRSRGTDAFASAYGRRTRADDEERKNRRLLAKLNDLHIDRRKKCHNTYYRTMARVYAIVLTGDPGVQVEAPKIEESDPTPIGGRPLPTVKVGRPYRIVGDNAPPLTRMHLMENLPSSWRPILSAELMTGLRHGTGNVESVRESKWKINGGIDAYFKTLGDVRMLVQEGGGVQTWVYVVTPVVVLLAAAAAFVVLVPLRRRRAARLAAASAPVAVAVAPVAAGSAPVAVAVAPVAAGSAPDAVAVAPVAAGSAPDAAPAEDPAPGVAPAASAGDPAPGVAPAVSAGDPAPGVAPAVSAEDPAPGVAPAASAGDPAPGVAPAASVEEPAPGVAPAVSAEDPAPGIAADASADDPFQIPAPQAGAGTAPSPAVVATASQAAAEAAHDPAARTGVGGPTPDGSFWAVAGFHRILLMIGAGGAAIGALYAFSRWTDTEPFYPGGPDEVILGPVLIGCQLALARGLGLLGMRRSTRSGLPFIAAILCFVSAGLSTASALDRHRFFEIDALLQGMTYLGALSAMGACVLIGLALLRDRSTAPRWALLSTAGLFFGTAFVIFVRNVMLISGSYDGLMTLSKLAPLITLPADVGLGTAFVFLLIRRRPGGQTAGGG